MEIDWWTVLLQSINFLILVWLLQRFLFKPVARIVAERQRVTEDAFAEARAAKEDAETAQADYRAKVDALAAERRAMIQEARAQIEEERLETVDEAKTEAGEIVEAARRTIEAERADALSGLKRQAAALAADIAAGTLEGSGSPAVTEGFLDAVAGELAALSDDDRRALGVGGAGGWTVNVTTAHPLDDGAKDRFANAVTSALGPSAHPAFAVDDALIAGVRVAFPAAVIRLSWRDHLDGVRGLVVDTGAMRGG